MATKGLKTLKKEAEEAKEKEDYSLFLTLSNNIKEGVNLKLLPIDSSKRKQDFNKWRFFKWFFGRGYGNFKF